jgi:hypothetical protein
MVWHNEEVTGLSVAVGVLKRLLVEMKPFECLRLRLESDKKLLVFRKPWPGTNYVLYGNLSSSDVDRLLRVGERLGLKQFGNTASGQGVGGISFVSPEADCYVDRNCEQLLECLAAGSGKIVIQGVRSTVRFFPTEVEEIIGPAARPEGTT